MIYHNNLTQLTNLWASLNGRIVNNYEYQETNTKE